MRLALGCATAGRIVVYDIRTDRVSVFSKEGELLDEYRFLYNGLPIREFSCAPNGRLGFAGSSVRMGETGAEPGDIIRELLSLGSAELGDTAATMLRERIPSSEVRYLAPGESMPGSTWSHDAVFAASNLGGVVRDQRRLRSRVGRILLLDIGPDWALVRTRDDLDVQRVAVYTLVENQ